MIIVDFLRKIKRITVRAVRSVFWLCRGTHIAIKTVMRGKRFSKGYNTDKDIVIFGNGPSLNDLDILQVSQKYQIACVNWFLIKNEDFSKIRPAYYFLVDPVFFGDDIKKHFDKDKEIGKLKNALKNVDWDMEIIIPQGRTLQVDNPHLTFSYIPFQAFNEKSLVKFCHFLYRNNLAVLGMQNVLLAALHYFIVRHFRTVYMSGVDMSEFKGYTVDERNHVICTLQHSYGNQTVDMTECGSIPPGGFSDYLEYYSNMFHQIRIMSEFAEAEGVTLINLSENSYIDVIKKMNWKEIL